MKFGVVILKLRQTPMIAEYGHGAQAMYLIFKRNSTGTL